MGTGTVLAIDPGEKRTGFAVTDPLRLSVEPVGTYRGPGDGEGLVDHIASLADDRDLELLLVGNPVGPGGEPTARSTAVAALCERLAHHFPGIPIVRYDERWTTKEAETRLVESGRTGDERKALRDSWSAAVLLEDWIRSGEPR